MSAPSRRGPRPLPLHLMLGLARGMAALMMPPPSASGWPSWSGGWPRSRAGQAEHRRIAASLDALRHAGNPHAAELFRAAVWRRLWRADAALLRGIAAYRRHPHRRTLEDPPVLWREGAARLLDYGGRGRPVLFVPSLVNRAHVLDLDEGASLMRFLRANGVRPLLLDWGWPDEAARRFTLTDVVAGRLERALLAAPRGLVLAGYCMGGLLALAAALRQPARVRALALLATPWDFHAAPEGARLGDFHAAPEGARPGDFHAAPEGARLARLLPGLEPLMEPLQALPVDALQMLFALLDPYGVAEKFRAFGRLDPASARARRFVALEDWLNDGVPLAAPIAREAIGGWYGENTPMRGEWNVAGLPVVPRAWTKPAFVAIPARDRIVPPASARALAALLPDAALHEAAAGHVGMVAGMGAERALWRPLLDWLRTR